MQDEDVFPPDVLVNLHEGLAVGERRDAAFAEFDAGGRRDGAGQREIGAAAEYFHAAPVLNRSLTLETRDKKPTRMGGPQKKGRI